MLELKIFENEDFGKVRTVTDENGTPLFCGIDIAKALGYTNPRKAVRDHAKDGAKRSTVSHTTNQHGKTTKQIIETTFIPEPDIYRLIIKSKLPSAEKFENWLFEIVLPSIRKNGGYITHKKLEDILKDTDKTIGFLEQMIKAISKNVTP